MTQAAEVIVRTEGALGRLTLNRPQALNALNLGMVAQMTQALLSWRLDASIERVLIDHEGDRGFCAGGDIRMLAESGRGDGLEARTFFHAEYRLNHLLMVYPKPVIALMDGVTMGGGVGISLPARYRIATERTILAMPETGIGLFPDVGGGWHLSRLPGKTGLWLALTGARLRAADSLSLGLASHHLTSDKLPALKHAIQAANADLEADLMTLSSDPGSAPLDPVRADLDRLFAMPSVSAIVDGLRADHGDWAQAQWRSLATKSPQTLKVAFRLLAEGAQATDFAEHMRTEYRIGARVVARHDFQEGVRAVIIDKDNAPKWSPPDLAGVTDAMLDTIFAPLSDAAEWTPLPELAA